MRFQDDEYPCAAGSGSDGKGDADDALLSEEEERRLAYVALSRAAESLHVLYVASGGRGDDGVPSVGASRFLKDVASSNSVVKRYADVASGSASEMMGGIGGRSSATSVFRAGGQTSHMARGGNRAKSARSAQVGGNSGGNTKRAPVPATPVAAAMPNVTPCLPAGLQGSRDGCGITSSAPALNNTTHHAASSMSTYVPACLAANPATKQGKENGACRALVPGIETKPAPPGNVAGSGKRRKKGHRVSASFVLD